MLRLQLLVPHWQETADEMTPLLDSLALQQSVDLSEVGVVIAFDGPDAAPLPLDEWRVRYPFAIDDVHPENGGVSHARNAALDASVGEYVMFCDADDMFCDVCGLYVIFREMDVDGGFDTLVSVFREETRGPNGEVVYINRENDPTFVHGKVHRRQYLVDEGIRFDDDLTCHEDSYFNVLCRECAAPGRARYCESVWYMWKWRDASVCRHDPKYILRTYRNMIDSNDALVDEFTRRMMPEKANAYAASMFWDAYFTMNKREWREQENQEYRDDTERRFAAYVRKHVAKWDAVPETEKLLMSQAIRQRSILGGMLMEALTISQWLDRIQEKYPA